MVGHLVSLKWKYVQASFRRSVWAVIGLVIAFAVSFDTLRRKVDAH